MSRRICILLLAFLLAMPVARAQAAPEQICFPEIPNVTDCLQGRFAQYWNDNGGLPVFGYPITPTFDVITSSQVVLTQVVERNRLEYHPEHSPPFDILLGRLGVDALRLQGRDWQREAPGRPQPGCWFTEATGYNVCDHVAGEGFLSFYRSHGLDLGDPGISEGESLSLWGYPLTEPAMERNSSGDTVLTQWFERARFEYHPNNPPGERVVLGLLGRELYDGGPRPNPTGRPIPDSIATTTTTAPTEVKPDEHVARLFALANEIHMEAGCAPFRYDEALQTAAQHHVEDIASAKRIDHVGSDGATLRTRLDRVGYPYIRASESIAIYPTPEDAVRMWMNEPPDGWHRINMTSCAYTEAGVGRATDSDGRVWWVLDVASRQGTP
jgi:uncharacterized protein YkwD